MNIVEITGGQKFQREIAHKTVAYCIKQLLPRHRTLDIEIKLVTIKSDATGYAMVGDTNRHFEIEIDKNQTIKEFVTTICHEMVHVKQYARKEIDGIRLRWKGKDIPEGTDYINFPWEIEAYDLQEDLADDIWHKGIV